MSSTNDKLILPEGAEYATARQLAHRYQVSTKWVSARGLHLGATPISDATNSGLRYHVATADAYMESRRRRRPAPEPRRPKPAVKKAAETTRSGAPLLDFR